MRAFWWTLNPMTNILLTSDTERKEERQENGHREWITYTQFIRITKSRKIAACVYVNR